MKLDQISANGYAVLDVFDDATLAELIEITDSFTPDNIRTQGLDVRHVKFLSAKKIVELIHNSFKDLVKNAQLGSIELWRDYPNYTNLYHLDDPILNHVLIVYLDGHGQAEMGTGYIEDKEYRVNYKKNTGLLLLNSNQINHGMVSSVQGTEYRKVLYANWLSNKSPSR
jgi:hypothetical protein